MKWKKRNPTNPRQVFLTYIFLTGQHKKWRQFSHYKGTVRQALEKLNDLIDESDPDTDVPNIVHAFQTAEKIREDYPDQDWFHLTGLIHDLGKVRLLIVTPTWTYNTIVFQIMAFYKEPQWAVVGDTFVVGCKWSDNIVYRDTSFVENPDGHNKKYK